MTLEGTQVGILRDSVHSVALECSAQRLILDNGFYALVLACMF